MKWRAMLLATCFVAGMVGMTGCTVKQTEEGKLPDVDVKVEDGNLPKYDVDAPDVDVTTKEKQVNVPTDVDVKTEKRTVKVPEVDVKPPADGDQDPPQR